MRLVWGVAETLMTQVWPGASEAPVQPSDSMSKEDASGPMIRLPPTCTVCVPMDLTVMSLVPAELRESAAWWGTEPGVAAEGPPAKPVATGTLPTRPVLPGSRREVILRAGDIAPGEYILDVKGELAGEAINLSVPFAVFAPGLQARKNTEE